jgi:hypothetical protein
MREAQDELKAAEEQEPGRFRRARRSLHKAIEQTERALKAAGVSDKTEGGKFEPLKKYAKERHPRLTHALKEIIQAREQLKTAGHDFGGERDRTLRELREAAREVERALEPGSPERDALREVVDRLLETKERLGRDNPGEQVEKAHRAMERAIHFVKDSKGQFGDRRERLLERLEHLDRELKRDPSRAGKALEEAVGELEGTSSGASRPEKRGEDKR